jgi:hypothetical protein
VFEGGIMPEQHEDGKDSLNADGLLSRINHPILGAFIATWVVVNWKPIYILIRGLGDPPQTIEYVTNNYLTNQIWNMLLLPLIYTALFVIFGPLLKDYYGVLKKWSFAFANKWEPVKKTQYKSDIEDKKSEIENLNFNNASLTTQLTTKQRELDTYKTAYEFSQNNKGIETGNGIIDVAGYVKQYKGLQSEVEQLKVTNSKINLENLQLRAKVESLKSKQTSNG